MIINMFKGENGLCYLFHVSVCYIAFNGIISGIFKTRKLIPHFNLPMNFRVAFEKVSLISFFFILFMFFVADFLNYTASVKYNKGLNNALK